MAAISDHPDADGAHLGPPTRVHLNGIQIAPPEAPFEYQLEAATLERYRRMRSVNVDGVYWSDAVASATTWRCNVVTASSAGVTLHAVDRFMP